MTAANLKALCEKLGFGVAHVRRVPRKTQLRVYIAVRHESYPEVDEIRFDPSCDQNLSLYQHALKPNGYTQYDKHIGTLNCPELPV